MQGQSRLEIVDHPLLRVWMTRLRDQQTDSETFRSLVDRIATMLLLRAMAQLETVAETVQTPLAQTPGEALARPIAFVPILRAGLGMVASAQRLVPQASVWHLGLYRDDRSLEPVAYYNKLKKDALAEHTVFVLDPMLATAGTAVAVLDMLRVAGVVRPQVIAIIGAPEGIGRLLAEHPNADLYLAARDDRLTTTDDGWPSGYILPGLGDAGDRLFGT
ncbi:MAG: uracil phosphoribosyltransferase [Caldilineae bacterium]|nr:uracil phosphoribosyltransferase [Caldilineae bacterium]